MIRRLIPLVLAALMIYSGGQLFLMQQENAKAASVYERARELAGLTEEAASAEEAVLQAAEEGSQLQVTVDFAALQKEMPDIVGWIRVPGTRIDYPIVQGDDNSYYLKHDVSGARRAHGAVFLDADCDSRFLGRNEIIYGHNMKDGSMFKDLLKFREQDFFESHRYFIIETPERAILLKTIGCRWGGAEPAIRQTEFQDQQAFAAFVEDLLAPCSFGEDPEESCGQIFILATCSYEQKNARTFLFAVEA